MFSEILKIIRQCKRFPAALSVFIFFSIAAAHAENLPAAMMHNNKPVEPACLLLDLEDNSPDIRSDYRLTDCLPKGASLDTSMPNAPDVLGYVGYEFTRNFVSEDGAPGTRKWNYRYKYLGILRGHHANLIEFSNDEGERYTQIKSFDRVGDRLILADMIGGGDRCNSVMTDVFIKDDKLYYCVSITAADFPAFGDDDGHGFEPFADLESTVDSCFAVAHHIDGEYVQVRLNTDIFTGISNPDQVSDPRLQGCFNSVFAKYVQKGRNELDRESMAQFMKNFRAVCVK